MFLAAFPGLAAFLWMVTASLVGRVLFTLGMSYVTYTGFDFAVLWLLNSIKSNLSAMPVDIVAFLAWLWIDKAIGMIFSAYSAAMVFKLIGGASLTKLVTKGL